MSITNATPSFLCVALLAGSTCLAQPPAEDLISDQLRRRMERMMETGTLNIQGVKAGVQGLLPQFYARRHFRPVWTGADRVEELLQLLSNAVDHGLEPEDYFLSRLRVQARAPRPASQAADLDILLTEALVRYGYHRRFGKVIPETVEPNWNFKRAFAPGVNPAALLEEWVGGKSLAGFLDQRVARGPLYRGLQAALRRCRAIAKAGGWPTAPEGPALKPGASDPRIPVLRERLRITGELPAATPASGTRYDVALEEAVRRFQDHHALIVDGVVGRATLAALNVPVQMRIDQLRLSLERARWVFESIVPRYVAVNIAGFRAAVIDEGKIVWATRVVVGRDYRQTPVFRGEMRHLVLNPSWTVPPGILRKDKLPELKRDPSYLRREGIRVIDREGRVVDPASIDWRAYGDSIPYKLRQEPGPSNALGRIKFMFPNPHSVYLHDTPAKELFAKPERTFSSGCIRVEDPLRLAELVLNDPQWTRERLEHAIATGKTQTVRLMAPVPVFILYWTAVVDPDGTLRFYKDVYHRDPKLLAALNGEVRIKLPAPPAAEPSGLPATHRAR